LKVINLKMNRTSFVPFFIAPILFAAFFSCQNREDVKKSNRPLNDLMHSEIILEEAFELSWNLMTKGQQLADNGNSIAEILKIFPDSTLVQTNETDILFFMKGSVPMLIEFNSKTVRRSKNSGNVSILPQKINTIALFSKINSSYNIVSEENKEVDVVGSQRGEEGRQTKKAVLISPYLAEFGIDDDYYHINDIFKRNKNYRANLSVRQQNFSLNDFEDWAQFDIVHVSTHGKNFCGNIEVVVKGDINKADSQGQKDCRSILSTGIKHGYRKASEALKYINSNGYKGLVVISTKSFLLRSTFFDHFYGSGLANKIWYFSACEMGQLADMTASMRQIHKNGHFLHWTNSVNTDDASRAAKSFYSRLFENGMDANKSYEDIPRLHKTNLMSDVTVIRDGEEYTSKATTNLKIINTGVYMHGFELVEMLHPEENQTLQSGDFYPVEGDFGDGQKETIAIKVNLYGYSKTEFENQKLRFSLKVDNETVVNKLQFLPNTSGENIEVTELSGKKTGVELTIKNIKIADVGDKTDLTLKAYLHFDDIYFSIHSEKVNIRSEGILAIVDDGNSLARFYYDSARNALRVETDDEALESYIDEEGYFYFHNNNNGMPLGWVKSKAMASMFTGNFSFTSVANDKHVNDETGTFNFPIIAWAQKHKMSNYRTNSNFKEERVDCANNKRCVKFLGISGEEKGHYAIFNIGGKLIEMGKDDFNIKFTYGEYEVKLPNAAEISFDYPNMN